MFTSKKSWERWQSCAAWAARLVRHLRFGLSSVECLLVVCAALAGTAKGLVLLTRKFVPATLPFAIRQGVANLHRPKNRTLLLLLSLGLGTFLMMSLYLVQKTLLSQ